MSDPGAVGRSVCHSDRVDCRLAGSDFDIATAAGWYSSIAGVLAGFALLSILLPLDHESDSSQDESTAQAVVVYTCAFFCLLVLAFTYAVLSGRTADGLGGGAAAHEQLLNGSAFGLSTLLLLFGLHAVLRAYGMNRSIFQPAQRVILLVTSVVGPIVLLALQFGSALDVERYRITLGADTVVDCGFGGMPSAVWINLGITCAAVLAVILLAVARRRLPYRPGAPSTAAKAVLGFTMVVAVWGSVAVPLLPDAAVTSALFEHLGLAVGAGAAVMVAAASWMSR